jgi:hypothetical protein
VYIVRRPSDLAQSFRSALSDSGVMKPLEDPRFGKQTPKPESSRLEEARRIVEEYVDDLRAILKKLRQHLH